jgi:hypothetical protein
MAADDAVLTIRLEANSDSARADIQTFFADLSKVGQRAVQGVGARDTGHKH